jgi:hypothetical protein
MKIRLDTVITSELTSWPLIHTSASQDAVVPFYGPDSENLFKRNKREMPDNWMYHNTDIAYHFNKQGLRMKKNLEDVAENYILFSGASFTAGVGIQEESRFTELVSSHANLDFINFSGPLYSIKLQALSFFNFLKTNHVLPKIFVVEYTPCEGFFCYSEGNFLFYSPDKNADAVKYPNHLTAYKSLSKTDYHLQEALIWHSILESTCSRLKIKFIPVSFWKDDLFVQNKNIPCIDTDSNSDDINYCFARDIHLNLANNTYTAHPGIGLHREMTDVIIKLI